MTHQDDDDDDDNTNHINDNDVAIDPPHSDASTHATMIHGTGTATIPYHVFNLVKAIIGAGVLSLPSGIATYSGGYRSAIIPAIVLITIIGIMSGYGFTLIGHVCSITNTTSYRDAWKQSLNESSSWIPAVSVTCKTLFAILAYSMILKDTIYSLLVTYVPSAIQATTSSSSSSSSFVLSQLLFNRNGCLLFISSFVLLPLCLLKDLKSLAPFSLMGVIGMCYTAIAMMIRYYDQSYCLTTGSLLTSSSTSYLNHVPTCFQPSFRPTDPIDMNQFQNGIRSVLTPQTSILLAMLSTAYMAHFNAPKFYKELYNSTMKRYNHVVRISFGISILLTICIACYGYSTFGTSCTGLILNNYSYYDPLISISRIAVAISLIFSYPLSFTGARDGIIDLFHIPAHSLSKPLYRNLFSMTILFIITILAMITPETKNINE
jgi:amino acid permease